MKKNILIITIVLLSFCILPKNISAEQKESVYCPLCAHRNTDDPLYKKERQFYKKVDLIKKTYGDSIDTTALTYAVLHRYTGPDVAYEREYQQDFKEDEYVKRNEILSGKYSGKLTDKDYEIIAENEKYDLLTLAALVMVDSSRSGNYSDVCFMDGLTSDKLVKNIISNNSTSYEEDEEATSAFAAALKNVMNKALEALNKGLASAFNEITCTNEINRGTDSYIGDSSKIRSETERLRVNNIKNVCENGYIGGLFNGVKNINDEERKTAQKKVIAQEIIDKANYYRQLYGKESGDACVDRSSSVSGSYADWKQTDSRWKDVIIGDESDETLGKYGCLVTSMAIQISRSGSKLGSISGGDNSFNPGSFAKTLKKNGGFDNAANFTGKGYQVIAPNFKIVSDKSVNISDNASLAKVVSSELSSPQEGKYQKFLILRIKYANKGYSSSQHWVAVNTVEGNKVKIYDPANSGTTLDDNYESWTVLGYKTMYATDVEQGKIGSSVTSDCSLGDDLNRFIGFLAYNEGHQTCNFQGKGEGTGYSASTLAGDAGGQTTAFGITISDKEIADKIGYTSFSQELYAGCTEKSSTEKLLVATIDYLTNEWTQKQIEQHGITVNQHEKYMLASVNYGGIVLAVPIMEAIKTYGKESEQVFEAFKHSFGINYAISNGFHGLMRRRLTEYEIFMTGNYEAESSNYLKMPYIQNGLAMSKSEVMSHWPTKRDELLDGMDFAKIDGQSVSSSTYDRTAAKYGSSKEYECIDGNAVKKEKSE